VRKVVIMGAGGRDFHDFNVVFRDDPDVEVVAFTAAQVPGIDERRYPASLAGPRYPVGIPIRPEAELAALVEGEWADEVVLAYSDLSHEDVMHKASIALASGADFRLLGPHATMLESTKPVVAVCAARTGSGKSAVSLRVAELLRDAGLRVGVVLHPMSYGDLETIGTQRFASLEDVQARHPTLEERGECERLVEAGFVVWAGVDSADVLERAQAEADVIVWEGGNSDFSFLRPDLLIVVVDPLRAGQELRYHPAETNLRMADVVLVNKVDSADPGSVERVLVDIAAVNPRATVLRAESPVTLEPGPALFGGTVLVVEDGPAVTYGGLPFGAATVAARQAGARTLLDPRPHAVGSIAETFDEYPQLGSVLPAMGYSDGQLADLEESINAADCDAVVAGTPVRLGRLIRCRHPLRHATYELRELGTPSLADVLRPVIDRAAAALAGV
jgi:predicted GTPase